MNYAYRQGMAPSDRPWKVVQQFKASDGQREVYLDKKQRAALLAHSSPELATLLKGLPYTAARPTELTAARVGDYDAKSQTLKLTTHKGNGTARLRTVPVVPQAQKLFVSQVKNELPSAYLFTNPDKEPWTRHQYAYEMRQAVR